MMSNEDIEQTLVMLVDVCEELLEFDKDHAREIVYLKQQIIELQTTISEMRAK